MAGHSGGGAAAAAAAAAHAPMTPLEAAIAQKAGVASSPLAFMSAGAAGGAVGANIFRRCSPALLAGVGGAGDADDAASGTDGDRVVSLKDLEAGGDEAGGGGGGGGARRKSAAMGQLAQAMPTDSSSSAANIPDWLAVQARADRTGGMPRADVGYLCATRRGR